jgi:signal transduction histidine kinase
MQMQTRERPLLIYGAVLSLLAIGVFFIPGIGPALLRTNGYAPHGVCILWQPGLLWFHVVNDVLIGSSYVAIAVSLAYLVHRGRRELPFHWVLLAFGGFIISCGSTHFMEAWTFWQPLYWLSGYAKLITAVASVATAIALPPMIPRILGLLDAARVSTERQQQLQAANAELARLNARLSELDELKSQLFANVSHELRTPLTLILAPVERLLAVVPQAQQRDLETIQQNARLLQHHVDDLLDVARLEAGGLELQRASVDLSQMVDRTISHFVAAIETRRITLQAEAPAELRLAADPDQLQRILFNLIGNAVKFTPDGGTVRVSVRADGDQALLQVEDSGPGVPASQRETIFERFRQGESQVTRRFGGTGLGLAIARELAALHDGTISVDDSALGGARFTLALPIGQPQTLPALQWEPTANVGPASASAAPPADDTLPARAVSAEGQPHILVVEDNAEVRRFLAETLAASYQVTVAPDGVQGVSQALTIRPDLIVSDVMMPGLSGEQLVQALRQHGELEQTPIVMLTARADVDLRVRLLRDGAQDYLLKPFSPAELLARINNLLINQRARRTLQQVMASQEANLDVLSAEVAQLYAQAQAALQLRDEFIAIAAHELRTPVTALLGNTQLLSRRAERGDNLPERDLRAVHAIGKLGERIAAMIERLLDVARIEQGQLSVTLTPLDLTGLAAHASDLLRPVVGARTLHIQAADEPLMILGDAERLTQVLTNLLANAAKFSAEGTTITVRITREEASAIVAIQDEGRGIPPEALTRLFERFYRASNTSLGYSAGLGLGLYLARGIVQLHGGELTVASVEGQGSTFTISLPLLDEALTDEAQTAS